MGVWTSYRGWLAEDLLDHPGQDYFMDEAWWFHVLRLLSPEGVRR